MVDNLENSNTESQGGTPANGQETAEDSVAHVGLASEGWSSPQGDLSGQGISPAMCMLGKLVLKRGGAETDIEYPINPPCVIGRFDPSVGPVDIDLGPIPEGSYISRKHAEILCEDGGWKVRDLGSSNGTFVVQGGDFERIEDADIHDGQEVAFGNARFVFHDVSPTPESEQSEQGAQE